jgi:hypothetical protein
MCKLNDCWLFSPLKEILKKMTALPFWALLGTILVYFTIIATLNRGISCDEGYYLLGYLRQQSLGNVSNEFHYIIQFMASQFNIENVCFFRAIRLILNIVALLFFSISSYKWIKYRFNFQLSPILYYSLIFLAGAMSFTYAAPTISFDHLQQIFYLSIVSMLFYVLSNIKRIWKLSCSIVLGFLLVFSIVNYIPSGILLIAAITIILFIEGREAKITISVFVIIGFIVGLLFYHFRIHNLIDVIYNLQTLMKVESSGVAKHDSASLIYEMIVAIGKLLLLYIPVLGIVTLIQRLNLSHIIVLLFYFALALILILFRQVYNLEGLLFFFPIAILFGLFFKDKNQFKKFLLSKDSMLMLIFIALPFMGIFGTNQQIYAKILLFLPFWMISFILLLSQFKNGSSITPRYITGVFVVLLVAGYFYLGNFSRFQYYYTPRSSKKPFVENIRYKSILVSNYQQSYYHDIYDTLKMHGFRENDEILAFGENQIAVYLAGGYFHGGLVYHGHQYAPIPKGKAQFLILFKNEEAPVTEMLKSSAWNFPASYNRIEMRAMSENMNDNLHKTIIYYVK